MFSGKATKDNEHFYKIITLRIKGYSRLTFKSPEFPLDLFSHRVEKKRLVSFVFLFSIFYFFLVEFQNFFLISSQENANFIIFLSKLTFFLKGIFLWLRGKDNVSGIRINWKEPSQAFLGVIRMRNVLENFIISLFGGPCFTISMLP